MTTSKAKKKASSKPLAGLLSADLIPISSPQSSVAPPYSDSGVGFEGYSKVQVSGGYKINPQTPFFLNYTLNHPWTTGTGILIFNQPGRVLFVTKIAYDYGIVLATGTVRWYINRIPASSGSQYNDAIFSPGEHSMINTDFKQPLRFENECYIYIVASSTSVGERLEFIVYGYSEPL